MPNEDLFAKYGGLEAQMLSIDLMEGHDFEYWCAGLLRKIGFSHVEVTPGSNDQGVDILAQKDDVKYAIQCKRYSHDLGNTPVQEVHAGKSMYNCHVGVVLTNQHFTKGAHDLAKATGVLLWDREWIKSNLVNSTITDIPKESTLESDELFSSAVDVILDTQQASVSMLQYRLKLGYARAARILDEMEEKGIVGPFRGSQPRSILITKTEWNSRMGREVNYTDIPRSENRTEYTRIGTTPDIPEDPPILSKAFHINRIAEVDGELPFWKKMLHLLKNIANGFLAWIDSLFVFTMLGEIFIGKPSTDLHFVYILVFVFVLPVVISIALLSRKNKNHPIWDSFLFWIILLLACVVCLSIFVQ